MKMSRRDFFSLHWRKSKENKLGDCSKCNCNCNRNKKPQTDETGKENFGQDNEKKDK